MRTDPIAMVSMAALLAVTAVAATLIPIAPAVRIDPARTLARNRTRDTSYGPSDLLLRRVRSTTMNADITRAWMYHNATKHSERSLPSDPHFLDWENQPAPLNSYTSLEPIPVPREEERTGIAALSAISEHPPAFADDRVPTLNDLVRILYSPELPEP